ncbi:ornithine cyclodeaminase family protein [Arthrobacter sp. RT-1]|uniref:ornithine cyclodeaminase family protein n=1 Tax=Arthrobacter sp. RT-1 TaxID=2292263 RepID=UPI000E1EDF63|nr:ornithine cyclodeaminase family protein [Arthrobacter sp. RT-1]RDV10008.1 ornithine cyclodeaminase family protein [Arthrobacter sp. RT-1]
MSTDGELPKDLPLFLTDADVASLSDWPGAIEAIRTAYKAPGEEAGTPGRIFAQTDREWLRIMPSVPPSGQLFGAKSIAGSFADGLRVSYLISLFDKDSADLVALVDGNRVTGLRTAATTAVGASSIVPSRPLSLGVIGSGFEARSHLTAFSHVLEFADIRVFSPTPANREAFAAEFDGVFGTPARAVGSAREAAEGADLILCAARSRDESPTLQAEWVGPNSAVVSIGSTTPAQRELPAELMARAAAVVVDTREEVVHGSGDMIAARAHGVEVDSLVVTLNAVLTGETEIDVERGIRIYKSTGSGLQDIVVAEMLVVRARAEGIGTILPVGIVTSRK